MTGPVLRAAWYRFQAALATRGGASRIATVNVLAAQHPAEIVNYKSMGTMPEVLAGGLAAGALAGLGLTLNASIRQRRHDFALLLANAVAALPGRKAALTPPAAILRAE